MHRVKWEKKKGEGEKKRGAHLRTLKNVQLFAQSEKAMGSAICSAPHIGTAHEFASPLLCIYIYILFTHTTKISCTCSKQNVLQKSLFLSICTIARVIAFSALFIYMNRKYFPKNRTSSDFFFYFCRYYQFWK